MKLLFTYEDREDGERALEKIVGEKRLASERDGTTTVYNLFGTPSWGNFYRLGLFDLLEYEKIIAARSGGLIYDESRYASIFLTLQYVAKQYQIKIPEHWNC